MRAKAWLVLLCAVLEAAKRARRGQRRHLRVGLGCVVHCLVENGFLSWQRLEPAWKGYLPGGGANTALRISSTKSCSVVNCPGTSGLRLFIVPWVISSVSSTSLSSAATSASDFWDFWSAASRSLSCCTVIFLAAHPGEAISRITMSHTNRFTRFSSGECGVAIVPIGGLSEQIKIALRR